MWHLPAMEFGTLSPPDAFPGGCRCYSEDNVQVDSTTMTAPTRKGRGGFMLAGTSVTFYCLSAVFIVVTLFCFG